MSDELDAFMRPEVEPATDDTSRRCMAVRERTKNSLDMDAWDVALINAPLDENISWPIPCYEAPDRMTPEPLSKQDVAILEHKFGVTADEWTALYTRERPLP